MVEHKATSLCCVVSATMCHTYGLRPPRASTLAMRGVNRLFVTSRACEVAQAPTRRDPVFDVPFVPHTGLVAHG